MREIVLRDFFLGAVSPSTLADDVAGAKKKTGASKWMVEIEDMAGHFSVTRPMLVSLCDAVLTGEFPVEELSTVGFALAASRHLKKRRRLRPYRPLTTD